VALDRGRHLGAHEVTENVENDDLFEFSAQIRLQADVQEGYYGLGRVENADLWPVFPHAHTWLGYLEKQLII